MEGWGAEVQREHMVGWRLSSLPTVSPGWVLGVGWRLPGVWGVSGSPLLPPPTFALIERSPQASVGTRVAGW